VGSGRPGQETWLYAGLPRFREPPEWGGASRSRLGRPSPSRPVAVGAGGWAQPPRHASPAADRVPFAESSTAAQRCALIWSRAAASKSTFSASFMWTSCSRDDLPFDELAGVSGQLLASALIAWTAPLIKVVTTYSWWLCDTASAFIAAGSVGMASSLAISGVVCRAHAHHVCLRVGGPVFALLARQPLP